MTSKLNPYLSFKDTARPAMEFYQSVLGGELTINTFAEFGGGGDGVMHASLETPDGFTLFAADTPDGMAYVPAAGIAVSLSGDDDALRGYWEKLSAEGTVVVPFEKQPWGDEFGQCVDRFGISWMVNVAGGA